MICTEDIKSYRIPRWDELPDLDLYMDQVISVLEKYLSLFAEKEKGAFITPTMINNYVKQKLVTAPKNKKYNKGHIASFYIITMLKQIMSISEINTAITTVVEKMGAQKGYDLFCDIFEASLNQIFFKEAFVDIKKPEDDSETFEIISSIALAYSNMLYARSLLFEYACAEDCKKDKKEKKK